MTTIETVYTGELRTRARHLKSGMEIITDAPPDNQGKGEAFSPTDLLAAALGSCMLTIMGIRSNKHDVNIDGTKIEVTKIMAAGPRRVSEVHVTFTMPEHDFSNEEREMLYDAAVNCPVAKSVHPDIKQEVVFKYPDGGG